MGRKKLELKKIEDAASRDVTYIKRKEVMVKKAHELSVLCDTDVGFIMISPTGGVNTFASNGKRVEDIFLRLIDQPDVLRGGPIRNEAFLSERLKQVKNEAKMLEKIEIIENLEARLAQLKNRKCEVQEKLRIYNANVEKMKTTLEIDVNQGFLINARQRIQHAKAIELSNQAVPKSSLNAEAATMNMDNVSVANEQSADLIQNSSAGGADLLGVSLPVNPDLSVNYVQAQKHWSTMEVEPAKKFEGY